jgi:DNA-binding transcriptional ArsR family regulator
LYIYMSKLTYDMLDMSQQVVLREPDLAAMSLLFQALASEPRVRILNLLRRGTRSVGEIAEALKLEQTVVSHNLKCLAFCGLVSAVRMGKVREYSVNHETLDPIFSAGIRHIARYANNLRTCESLER